MATANVDANAKSSSSQPNSGGPPYLGVKKSKGCSGHQRAGRSDGQSPCQERVTEYMKTAPPEVRQSWKSFQERDPEAFARKRKQLAPPGKRSAIKQTRNTR